MRNVGIGLCVFGLVLCLLGITGVELPDLSRNLKSTKSAVEKFNDLHKTSTREENVSNFSSQESNKNYYDEQPIEHQVYKEEPNYSKIYKNNVRNPNDYVAGSDGKIYENKPCFNCSGEGLTFSINPATGQKQAEVCNACEGVGQIGY